MARWRDQEPLNRAIQRGQLLRERRDDGRCIECGNWADGKSIEGEEQTGTGEARLDLDSDKWIWLCAVCKVKKEA